jgi:hypothetical protein
MLVVFFRFHLSYFAVAGEAGSTADPLLECGHIPDIAQIQVRAYFTH